MSIRKEKLFTTGEFAHLCKVNKQTLIYYDQIGLLAPIMRDEKGYRYYSITQYEVFSVIELLKEVGMTLKEIQAYMANKSPENFSDLMRLQKEVVSKKRRELEMIENMIHVKSKLIEEALNNDFDKISLEYMPECTMYLSPTIENSTEEQFVAAVSDFIEELYRAQLDSGYPIGGMTKREHVLKGDYSNYSYLYMEQPNPREGHPYFKAVGGSFLVGYHVGTADAISSTYERLLSYMQQHGYCLGKYVYEEYIYDAVLTSREEEYVTKIMMEVTTNGKGQIG